MKRVVRVTRARRFVYCILEKVDVEDVRKCC